MTENKNDEFISAKQVALLWAYRASYEAFWEMRYGTGLRPELARALGEVSPQLNVEDWLAAKSTERRKLNEFIPENLAEQDWVNRRSAESERDLDSLPEPDLFARLMRANAPRTVRKVVTQSRSLWGTHLAVFLQEQPERFLSIKKNRRFPRSSDKRIEFLARSCGAVIAGYRPSTGRRYLAKLEVCEQCHERRAVLDLIRDGNTYPWCGAC